MNDQNDQTRFQVALITDVFYDDNPRQRLADRLGEAKQLGAELAVLPEIPCLPWAPATKNARDEHAEEPGGPSHQMQADAARAVGIGLVGGVIQRNPDTGSRYNTSLVFDAHGELLGTHQKWHLPEEPAFWETSHYEPGVDPPTVIDGFRMPLGVQICSDINRPEGTHILAAMGAQLIVNPRATEAETYWKWKPVFQANAVTSCTYIVSVNRPGPDGVGMGGPSLVVAPDSSIMVETTDPVHVVALDRSFIDQRRIAYPGYLPVRADLYAQGWAKVKTTTG
ncbi:MAG: carbon-nitrogen hydrolase family protein [Planctomycetota bacterium]|nr:carbon-nitrogen hydrolase family protein [Planctomycetota bacterium]